MSAASGYLYALARPLVVASGIFVGIEVIGPKCESIDDFDSRTSCSSYCDKNYDCDNRSPTAVELDDCVASCRNAIEDSCGNENQAEANDKIGECVDKSCLDFRLCMTFEAAPECFGFVSR